MVAFRGDCRDLLRKELLVWLFRGKKAGGERERERGRDFFEEVFESYWQREREKSETFRECFFWGAGGRKRETGEVLEL